MAAKIDAGPEIGACGGCELDYGKQIGAEYAAWIVVQKVSDLILNINVYMADVADRKWRLSIASTFAATPTFLDPGHHLSGEELSPAGPLTTPASARKRLAIAPRG